MERVVAMMMDAVENLPWLLPTGALALVLLPIAIMSAVQATARRRWRQESAEQVERYETVSRRAREYGERMEEKDKEIQQMKEKEEAWNAERLELIAKSEALSAELAEKAQALDKLYTDQEQWDCRQDEILACAHSTAEQIIDEATRRLAESEEEVRKNRLIAAESLNDARRRISDMLLSAARELSRGLNTADAEAPIGYAPVYSIQERESEKKTEETE